MILRARHPDLDHQEKTFLSAKIAAGATTITVKSPQGFSIDDFVVLGTIGQERTEIKQISGLSGLTISFATGTTYAHSVDAPVTTTPYNQVEFYRAASSGGTYSLIATSTIDYDEYYTRYDYIPGVSTDYYKIRYLNSDTLTYSEFSGEMSATGYVPRALASILLDIRIFTGDKPSDDDLLRLVNLSQETVYAERDNWYFARKKETYTTVAATDGYDLPTYFKTIDNTSVFHISSTDSAATVLTYMDYNDFKALYSNATASDTPSNYTIDENDGQLLIGPTPSAGGETIEMWYYAVPTPLTQYSDITDIPSPRPLVFWTVYQLETAKKNLEQAKVYNLEYQRAISQLGNKRLNEPRAFKIG